MGPVVLVIRSYLSHKSFALETMCPERDMICWDDRGGGLVLEVMYRDS